MSSDKLERLFAKLRQVRLANPVNTGPSAGLVYTGPSSEASPIQILVDPCLTSSVFATSAGGFALLQIPFRILLDPCLPRSVVACPIRGFTLLQARPDFRSTGSAKASLTPTAANFRAAFDSRAVKSSPRRDLPIVDIDLSSQSNPVLTCGELQNLYFRF